MTSNLSWLDSFGRSEEQDKEFFAGSNLSAVKPQKKEPGLFDGTLDALGYMVPNAFFQTMGGAEELSAYKLSQMYELDLDNNEDALSEPIKADKDKIIQRAENEAKYYRLKAKNDWTPNPETTGAAAQMIHAMGSTILKAAGYSVIAGGNPYFGGAMFGTDIGLNEYGTLRDKGVDAKTAKQAGWASGALNALGLAIPGSIGTNYLYSAGLGAVVNPASDVLEQGAIKYILENADYEKIAGEYDPFNPANLAVSSGMGVVFGLMGAKGARSRAIRAEKFAQQDAEEAQKRAQENPAQPEGEGEEKPVANSRLNQEVLNSIQNRDRSSQESVIQMRKIAEKPDFNLISESRVLENGSPVIAFVENPNPKTIGKEVIVSASDGRRMTMRYAVVEADSILTSNDVEGFKNPDFANPNVLGARAIAGNGRVAGVKSAYQHGTAGDYRAELMDQSKQFGISRRKIKNMRQPILVRIMKDEDVKTDVGELSNRSGIQKLNPVEQAAQDARNVNVEDLEFNADGTFSQKSIQGFVHANPDKEGMLDPRGNIIADNATQRMRTAVFSAAYGDNSLVSRFIANSNKDRKIFTALLNVAPDLVRLRKLGGNFDFSNSLVEAVADVFETRKETKGLQRGENTMPLYGSSPEQEFFKQVLLSKNPEKIKDIVRRMNEIASNESEDSFAEFGSLTREDVFNSVKNEFSSLDLTPDLETIALLKGIDEQITSTQVDAAMELNSARVITQDQPSGPNGNINKSLQDEATAREQIDDGKKVEVTGEGVDPEVMDKNVSSFITRFVKELVGAGADKKIAGMNARIIDAFFSTMGIRLGKSRKEIEAEYELKVQKGEEPQANSYAQQKTAEQKLAEESKNWECFVDSLTSKPTNHVRMLTQTPVVMHLVGADFKELYATPHFFDRIFENKDGSKTTFTKEEIKKIPSALADPVAIFDQENGRKLFLLDFTTKSKAPILVPVEFNAQGEIATVNLAVSCFAKEKDGKPKWGWINSESLKGKELYVNKQKLSSMEPYSGANSLRVLQSRITESVLTEDDLVKERQKYPGYYQTQNEAPLVTVHNLSEENLNKAMDLGGLAVPSLGITKRDTAYADFGDISLIGTKDMVDPRKGTPVFSQDAYTQTFPEPVWEKSVKPEGAKEVSREFEAAAKESGFTDEEQKLTYSLQASPNRQNFIHSLLTSNVGAYLFLKSKGIKVDPVMTKPGNFSKIVTDSDFIKVAEEIYKTDPTLAESRNIKRLSDAYIESFEKNGGEGGPLFRKVIARAKENGTPLKKEKLRSLMSEAIESKKNFVPAEDKLQTGYALKDKANEYRSEFEQWAEKQADKAFSEPMIKVGNQLKPITLENVVKAMKSSVVVNKEKTMTVGAGKVRARSAQKFKSIEEIQNNRDKVTDSETASIQNAYIAGKMERFRQLASKDSNFQDSFDAFNEAMDALAKVAGSRGKITEDKVRAELKKRGFDASDETVKLGVDILERLDKSLTDYFEAKPQRAVKFNEFAGAVVPKKTAPETIARLEKEGIKVAIYDETLPDGRQKAITELTDSLQKERDDILYQNGRKGIYTPGERVITLLQSADESTFVHESGHYFLDVLTDIGSRERVPKQIKDDIQTLMDWFGVKDLEEWNSLSFEEKRQYHEKFARGFEQYLREGKAPSSTLEKVFKSFKDWLMKIYRSAEELDVELSPEVRSVYDRLLATDEQIKQRKAELEGRTEADTSTGQPGIEVPAQVTETINNLPIPEEAKGVLKNTLGIEEPAKTGENHPHSGIPTEEEFIRQSLETDSVRDPDAFIVDENGNEISLKDYLAEQDRIAEREIKDANAMGVAAECMWRQGAFDEI